MKEIILQLLKSTDEYISGQELCEKLNVTRTAIWKNINALKEQGYEIEAVRNRGYRLVSSPDVLLSDEIKSILDTKWFGSDILFFEEIDSTNNEVKRQAENGAKQGLLVVAERQTAGKGRRGRTWESPEKSGIWLSYLLKPECEPYRASTLTLVIAMACTEAFSKVTGIECQIKWPNDVVANGRKLTGILTEMSTELTSINYVVVGVGINVNMTEFPEDIRDKATSLCLECGSKVDRSRIIAEFGRSFEKYYGIFIKTYDMSELKFEYLKQLVNIGREVRIIREDDEYIRTAIGINDAGELLVRDRDGVTETIRSGEVSVRGIYGYV